MGTSTDDFSRTTKGRVALVRIERVGLWPAYTWPIEMRKAIDVSFTHRVSPQRTKMPVNDIANGLDGSFGPAPGLLCDELSAERLQSSLSHVAQNR